MQSKQGIRSEGPAHVHKSKSLSRLHLALTSSGILIALLIGGFFCFHSRSASAASSNANYYQSVALQAAASAGIDSNLFLRQIQQESGFNPNALSPAGAEGIAQFMPGTAASVGVDPWSPTQALYGAARLMSNLLYRFGGNYAMALAAYNAGPNAVQSAIYNGGGNWLAWMPSETRNYVAIILGW